MKKRMRTLIRQEGWHPIETHDGLEQYMEMRKWCNTTYAKNTWQGKIIGHDFGDSTKKFIFKRESDKLMFMLRWSK